MANSDPNTDLLQKILEEVQYISTLLTPTRNLSDTKAESDVAKAKENKEKLKQHG